MSQDAPEHMRTLARELSRVLGRIAIREALSAAAGLKPVRISTMESDIEDVIAPIRRHGLAVAIGSCTQWIAKDRGKGGWSSASGVPGSGEPWRHLYVARDTCQAELLRSAEEHGSDEEFGRLLLIPACCRAMFQRNRGEAESVQCDFFRYTYPDAMNVCPWLVHIGAQYFDASMLSHYPCSPACADSHSLARIAWRIHSAAAPDSARASARLMQAACIYSEDQGICLLTNAVLDGEWVTAAGPMHSTSGEGPLHSLVSRSRRIYCPRVGEIVGESQGKTERFRANGLRIVLPQCEVAGQ
jgi:hypothetical protein